MDPIEGMKEVLDLARELNRMDLYRKLVEVNQEVVTLAGQKVQLHQKVLALEEELRLRDELVWRDNAYWKKDEPSDGPYCPKCRDGNSKAVRMMDLGHVWRCPVCTTAVRKPGGDYGQHPDFPSPRLGTKPEPGSQGELYSPRCRARDAGGLRCEWTRGEPAPAGRLGCRPARSHAGCAG